MAERNNTIDINKTESVASCDQLQQPIIESLILSIRAVYVILDVDIAKLYGIETKRLNEQVRRNASRFPPDFMFQLSQDEFNYLRSHFATANWSKRRTLPYAFTELGVSMLSSVLTSEIAIQTNVQIMRAFVTMRRFMMSNANMFQRLDRIEYKLIESDHKFEDIYSKLEEKSLEPQQGIFYDGQVFDSYKFIIALIKSAAKRIIVLDNYVDISVLTMRDNRSPGVDATIYTLNVSRQFQLDIIKHDRQYPPVAVKQFSKSHDRFLIIDNNVYHIGASLKDLGSKWFAFSLMEETTPEEILSRL